MSTARVLDLDQFGMAELRELIRSELATTTDPDPRSVVSAVAAAIPQRQLRSLVEGLLVDEVRRLISLQRNRIGAALARPAATSKWDRYADLYTQFLRRQEAITETGEWKFLGDCTYDDLLAIVAIRDAKARQNLDAADRYRRLADALTKAGVTTVAELDPAIAMEAMQ